MSYDWEKSNLSCRFKLKSITTYRMWFVVKILWKCHEHSTSQFRKLVFFFFFFFLVSCVLSNVCGCSLRLVRIGLGIFYFILFFVCVLRGFVLGCCLGLSLLLVNFVVKLVKFISNFRSIKFFIAFKKINNIVERAKWKFIETNC